MKKRIYKKGVLLGWIVICCCLFSLNVFAQNLKYGIMGGVSYGKVNISDNYDLGVSIDFDYRVGFTGGLFMIAPINKILSIESELLYIQKGAEKSISDYDYKMRLHMLEIPVLARINIPIESSSIVPYFYGGPFLGIKLGSHYKLSGDGYSDSGSISDLKSYEIGLAVGGGVEIGSFRVDLRYDWGLTDLSSSSSDFSIKTRTWLFMLGYMF